MDAFWCLFNNSTSSTEGKYLPFPTQFTTLMEKHWLNMLAPIVNNLMAQLTPPLSAAGAAIYNLLNEKFVTSSGSGSIASICAESDPARTQDLLNAFNAPNSPIVNILNQLDDGRGDCALAPWYSDYGFETPQQTTEIDASWRQLQVNLERALNGSGSWDDVVGAINDLDNILNTSGPLNGFNLFLRTYLEASCFDQHPDTPSSLVSLATAINAAGGVAKDPADATLLQQLFLPNKPNTDGGMYADFLSQDGWVNSNLYWHDYPL
jgi:hypothetical protein